MKVEQFVGRRRLATLLLLFVLVTCTIAEEGVLVVIATDTGEHPFPDVRIGTAGDGGSPQTTDQNGKARLKLAPGTKPNSWVKLLIGNAPNGVDVVFISPYDGRIRVPPYDNEQDNYDPVVLVKRGDKAMLESGSGMLAIHAAVKTSAAAQRKKPTNPSSQNYRRHPTNLDLNVPHLQTASLRASSSALNYGDPLCTEEELQQAALAEAALTFGLSVQDVKGSIAVWGGDALVWGEIILTASIEASGTNPFPFVRTAYQDIQFGSGTWGLRECSLQPVLLQFEQRDRRRFAEIIGADAEWLSKTMSGPCEASAKAALRAMLDDSGHLSALWRSRFRDLGNEHSFQHVQVEQVDLEVTKARTLASALGLQSEQAVAFLAAPAIRSLVSAAPKLGESYLQVVANFTRQNGRPPGEQEKLLILRNKTIESWNEHHGNSPRAMSDFMPVVNLFYDGSGMVSGRHYDLDDLGLGPRGTQPCRESETSRPAIGSACAHDEFDPAGEEQLVDLINQERTKRGISSLQVDPRLSQAARKHTGMMVQHHALSHQFDDEPPMMARFNNENLPFDKVAENISFAPNVAAGHESMMHSPDHRANILNPDYNVVGVGAVQCGAGLWVTQDFAHRLPEYSEAQADGLLQEAINQYAQEHGMPQPTRKPQSQLRNMACEMARNGAVNREAPGQLPGVNGVVVWRTGNPAALPPQAEARLSRPMTSGYSIEGCFAPGVRHTGGIFWVIMVTY
jgi:uncharacterized protein YkwD